MDITFEDAELARVCNSDAARRARFGAEAATVLLRRLGEMAAAACLADLRHLASARLRTYSAANGSTHLIAVEGHGDLVVRTGGDPPRRPRRNPGRTRRARVDRHRHHDRLVTRPSASPTPERQIP